MVDLGEDDEKFESFMTPITSKNTFGYLPQWNSQGWRIHWANRFRFSLKMLISLFLKKLREASYFPWLKLYIQVAVLFRRKSSWSFRSLYLQGYDNLLKRALREDKGLQFRRIQPLVHMYKSQATSLPVLEEVYPKTKVFQTLTFVEFFQVKMFVILEGKSGFFELLASYNGKHSSSEMSPSS